MRPILELERTHIDIVFSAGGAVDDHWTHDTFPSLNGEVGVVPRSPVILGNPCVSHGRSWSDWALSNGGNTIVHVVVQLSNTVEMDRCTIVVCKLVVNSDNDSVTPAGLDCRARHLSIDPHDWPCNTIWAKGRAGNVKVVVNNFASDWGDLVAVGVDIVTTELALTLTGTRSAVWQGRSG